MGPKVKQKRQKVLESKSRIVLVALKKSLMLKRRKKKMMLVTKIPMNILRMMIVKRNLIMIVILKFKMMVKGRQILHEVDLYYLYILIKVTYRNTIIFANENRCICIISEEQYNLIM